MSNLFFTKSLLYITSNNAIFTTIDTAQKDDQYIFIEITPDITGEFIQSAIIRYKPHNIELILSFDEQSSRKYPVNSRDSLNESFDNITDGLRNNVLQGYTFNNTDLSVENRFSMIYASNLVGLLFIIWLSFINAERSGNLFNPFRFEAIVNDDSVTSLFQGLNRETIVYLRPPSMLVTRMRLTPIHKLLQLSLPWGQIFNPYLLETTDLRGHSVEGTYVAVDGVISLLPRIMDGVNQSADQAQRNLQQIGHVMHDDQHRYSEELRETIARAREQFESVLVEAGGHREITLNSFNKARDAIFEQLRVHRDDFFSKIDQQRATLSKQLGDASQSGVNDIVEQQNKTVTYINQVLSKANEEYDVLIKSINDLINEHEKSLKDQITRLDSTVNMVSKKVLAIDSTVSNSLKSLDHKTNQLYKYVDTCTEKYNNDCIAKAQSLHKIHEDHCYKTKCHLDNHTNSLKGKAESYIDDAIKRVVYDKVTQRLSETGQTLETEVKAAIKKLIHEDYIDKEIVSSLHCIKNARDQAAKSINENYIDLHKSVQKSETAIYQSQANKDLCERMKSKVKMMENKINSMSGTSTNTLVSKDKTIDDLTRRITNLEKALNVQLKRTRSQRNLNL